MIAASNSQRILGCPICGYRVSTRDRVCPRCGSEFDTGTKFECPLCGGLVDSNARSCPSCHVDYGDFREKTIARGSDDDIDTLLTEIIGLESAQVKKEDKRYSCPKCSWMLDGSESVCPRCNHDLVSDLSFQCPMCGTIVGSSTKACPECGVSFQEPEERQRPPRQTPSEVEPIRAPSRETTPAPEPKLPPSPAPRREPAKEVKPIVVVKAPPIVSRPAQAKPPETPSVERAKAEVDVELELSEREPEPAQEKAEEALETLETIDEEEKAAQPSAPVKKGTKKRKLKAKPKG